MKKYAFVFTVSYLIFVVVLVIIAEFVKIKGSAVFTVVPTTLATYVAAWFFSRDYARESTPEETTTFTWQALLSIWIVTLVMFLPFTFFLPPSERDAIIDVVASKTSLLISLGVVGFLSAILFIIIRWSFAWFTRLSLREFDEEIKNPISPEDRQLFVRLFTKIFVMIVVALAVFFLGMVVLFFKRG